MLIILSLYSYQHWYKNYLSMAISML